MSRDCECDRDMQLRELVPANASPSGSLSILCEYRSPIMKVGTWRETWAHSHVERFHTFIMVSMHFEFLEAIARLATWTGNSLSVGSHQHHEHTLDETLHLERERVANTERERERERLL